MYQKQKRGKNIKVTVVVVTALLLFFIGIPLCYSYFATKTYTVTVTDKDVKNSSSNSKYLVFTKLENGETKVFSVEDSLFKWRWNSSDVYADIEVDKTYEIEVIGWRIPIISEYENIMKFSETK